MLVIAAVRDTGYEIVLVLHILSAIVAFAPAIATVVTSLAGRGSGGTGGTSAGDGGEEIRLGRIVYAPALLLTGLFGIALVLQSDEAIKFSDGWVSAAFLVWILLNGAYHALVLRGMRAGGEAGRRQVVLGGQAMAVLAVVIVYLMVFKPGA